MGATRRSVERQRTPLAMQVARLLLGVCCLGSDCFPAATTTSDGGYVGPGAPSVELTVDGAHLGPVAADGSASASLDDGYDQFMHLSNADLAIHATGGGIDCEMHVSRFGPSGVAPFAVGVYTAASPTSDTTEDRTVSVVGSLSVSANGTTLQCSGSDCDGSLLSITGFDTAHIEGYVAGNFAATDDGQVSAVVCTFYVPWATYSP